MPGAGVVVALAREKGGGGASVRFVSTARDCCGMSPVVPPAGGLDCESPPIASGAAAATEGPAAAPKAELLPAVPVLFAPRPFVPEPVEAAAGTVPADEAEGNDRLLLPVAPPNAAAPPPFWVLPVVALAPGKTKVDEGLVDPNATGVGVAVVVAGAVAAPRASSFLAPAVDSVVGALNPVKAGAGVLGVGAAVVAAVALSFFAVSPEKRAALLLTPVAPAGGAPAGVLDVKALRPVLPAAGLLPNDSPVPAGLPPNESVLLLPAGLPKDSVLPAGLLPKELACVVVGKSAGLLVRVEPAAAAGGATALAGGIETAGVPAAPARTSPRGMGPGRHCAGLINA